jgi:Zn-dependent protease
MELPSDPPSADAPSAPTPGAPAPAPRHPGWSPPPDYGRHPGTWYPPPPGWDQRQGAGAPPPGPGTGPPGPWYPPPPSWGQPQGTGPPPPGWGGTPGGHRPASSLQRRGGAAGGILAAVFAFVKVALGLGKFSGTAITMLLAAFLYAQLFGWAFGIGIVALIFVHEMGHFLVSRALGVPMSAPVFVPFLGAFTVAGRGFQSSRRTEAVIAAAGPVFGFLGALAVFLWGISQPIPTRGTALAFALSYFGFLITLFNLIPMLPLDGGRIATALSKWTNLAGVAVFGLVLLAQVAGITAFNPFLLLVFLVGCYSVRNRFRAAREGREAPPLPLRHRALIGAGYIVLVAVSAVMMSLSNGWLVGQHLVKPVV